jgi:hypothetical protein
VPGTCHRGFGVYHPSRFVCRLHLVVKEYKLVFLSKGTSKAVEELAFKGIAQLGAPGKGICRNDLFPSILPRECIQPPGRCSGYEDGATCSDPTSGVTATAPVSEP